MQEPAITIAGRVTVTSRVNVRQGGANTRAPVMRKLAAGTLATFKALVVGEAVQGNPLWYQLDGDGFIWAGAAGPPQTGAAGPPPPVTTGSPHTPVAAADVGDASATVKQAGLEGFGLVPEFAARLATLILECRERGHMFRIGQGLRTPRTQALYYCQWAQRGPEKIDSSTTMLRSHGAHWTADLLHSLRDVKRQAAWQTNALPGAGWHQWGEAADCYCYRGGQLVGNGGDPSYAFYAETAEKIGLTAGLRFSKPDPGHVQLRSAGGATDLFSWSFIDGVMQDRFAGKPSLD